MKSSRTSKSDMKPMKIMKNAKQEEEKPKNFEECISLGCRKFNCGCRFSVIVEQQKDDFYKSLLHEETAKYKKIKVATPDLDNETIPPIITAATLEVSSTEIQSDDDEFTLSIRTVYDKMNHLVEVGLYDLRVIPREMMQIICLAIPYFKTLTRVSIRKCRITAATVVELNKMLPFSSINDICFDDSPLPEANYSILLDGKSQLNSLSLCRCKINDEVCRLIASDLRFSSLLHTLNLSSNHITDVGAKCIAEALRTNRNLRYLNLADNRISDDGAFHIFDSMMDFPLTYNEILSKRHRYHEYCKTRQNFFFKYLNDFETRSVEDFSLTRKKASPRKRKTSATSLRNKTSKKDKPKDAPSLNDDDIIYRAEALAAETTGPFVDPYSPVYTVIKNGLCYCRGNQTISYLNLAYNNLSYLSIKKLKSVIIHQNIQRIPGLFGLMKIVIDGNNLPVYCDELQFISDTLNKNLNCFGGKISSEIGGKRKSRAMSRISVMSQR